MKQYSSQTKWQQETFNVIESDNCQTSRFFSTLFAGLANARWKRGIVQLVSAAVAILSFQQYLSNNLVRAFTFMYYRSCV